MDTIAGIHNNIEGKVDFDDQPSENIRELRKGVIYYRLVNKNSAQAEYTFEDKYQSRKQIPIESNFLGSQVGDQITDNYGISISYFESGAIVSVIGVPEPIICTYSFPKIGNPGIVNPDRCNETKNFIHGSFNQIRTSVYDYITERRPHFFEEIFSNNFFLRAVSSKSPADDVLLFPEVNVEPVGTRTGNEREVNVSISFQPSPSVPLHDKTLFDLVFRFVNEFVLAPHGIFANKSWDNFVIMHVTDIHVSRRLEFAKDDLKKMSVERPDLINEFNIRHFNNFNDNFRDFISFANALHRNGSLDCILATGDLIDYIFDSAEQTAMTPRNPSDVDRVNGNNFDFLKRLILGLEPGRDGTKNEELLVPIFTSLGNHDYRDMPYAWLFTLEVQGSVFGIDIPFGKTQISSFNPTNLIFSEAIALEGGKRPKYVDEKAAKMTHIDRTLPHYEDTINSQRSYIVRLGPHRIVMLDSGPDLGILETEWDAFAHKLGWDSEDETRFAQSSPNCEGVLQEHIQLLNQALAEAGATGIVIVGIHAPLVDMSYYPHYLRETDRAAPDENVNKRGFPYFSPFFSISDEGNGTGKNSNWPMTGTPYFKFGGVDFTLANGVSKGLNQTFLEICAGVDVSRKVDLVLSGHGHHNLEVRLGFEPDKKLLFFHDYYTENPAKYYATKLLSESDFNNFISQFRKTSNILTRNSIFSSFQARMKYHFIAPKDGLSQPRFIQVDDTQEGGQPFIEERIEVPPYPTPLNKTGDKIGWWSKHRPILIQTVALGPVETKNSGAGNPDMRLSDYSFFHGCRKIRVRNNVISSIRTVHMSEIRSDEPRLYSLRELCRVRGILFPASLRSIAESFPASLRSLAEDIITIPPGRSKPRLCTLRELCRVRGVSFPASLRGLAEDIKSIPPISERLKIR